MTSQTHAVPDQSLFIVMRDWGKLGFESVSEPEMTRESIAEDIAKGQIYNVAYVIECNPIEGWSKVITDEIFAAADQRKLERAA
jgi:hypothetical protein